MRGTRRNLSKPSWQVLQAHAAAVHALLLRLTLRPDVADELLHDLYVKLATSGAVDKADNPGSYLRRAAINLAMDWRRRRRIGPALPDVSARMPDLGQALADAEEVDRILNAAQELPELARQAFALRFVQNESYEDVGVAVGRSAHQARGLCHWAVSEIRLKLGIPRRRQVIHERVE
jgi:RNA polymerase sigma factor (sigma-70 family)